MRTLLRANSNNTRMFDMNHKGRRDATPSKKGERKASPAVGKSSHHSEASSNSSNSKEKAKPVDFDSESSSEEWSDASDDSSGVESEDEEVGKRKHSKSHGTQIDASTTIVTISVSCMVVVRAL